MRYFLAFLAATGFCLATATEVVKDHPRLWIVGQPGIDVLKKRVQDIPGVKERYELIKKSALSDGVNAGNLWTVDPRVISLAIAYIVEDRSPAILAKLKQYAEACCTSKEDAWLDPHCMKALAIIYDWAFQDLSQDERQRYVQAMVRLRGQMEKRWRHSDYNNHIYVEWGQTVYAGLAFHGDGIDDAASDKMMEWSRDYIYEHGIKAVNQLAGPEADGGWQEGRGYHSFCFYEIANQWEAWRVATGEDPFTVGKGLSGSAKWMLHTTRPHDDSAAEVADIRTIEKPALLGSVDDYFLSLVATRYQDPIAQHLVQKIPISQYAFNLWAYVLWYDAGLEPEKLETLPTAAVFRGLGWATMRSTWQQDATSALFVCGDYFSGHQHMDQNQLIIRKLGYLAIDACEYGAKATKYHNTILIGGEQRPFDTDPIGRYQPVEKGGRFDCGDLLAWEDQDPNYTYVCGEAANAYPEGQVTSFTRQVVYCRPDIFVVFDRTLTPQPQPREWLLHSLTPAAIDNGEITITDKEGLLWAKTLHPKCVVAQEPITGGQPNRLLTHNHITVVPEQNAQTGVNFLTVFAASAAASFTKPTVTSANDHSVEITQGAMTWKLTFGAEGNPSGHITITGAAKPCDRDLAAGMP
jgi:hypothetical protein